MFQKIIRKYISIIKNNYLSNYQKNIFCKIYIFTALIFTIFGSVQAKDLESAFSALKNNDVKNAFEIFSTLAENGDNNAQSTLAVLYSEGVGTQKDQRKAIYWYTASAEQGNWISQHSLGEIYSSGNGIAKSSEKSHFWWWLACNNKSGYIALAEKCNIFKALLTPLELEKIEFETKKWNKKPLEVARKIAFETLTLSIEVAPLTYNEAYEELTKGNYSNAFQGFIKLANEGDKFSQGSVALMYQNGHGVAKDFQKAAYWFLKSAEQGESFSQTKIALLYYVGYGVPLDYKKAYFWFILASKDGDPEAVEGRNVLERKLTSEQRSEVQGLASNWRPVNKNNINSFSKEGNPGQPSKNNKSFAEAPDSTGSGFRVANDSFITNNHVVAGCSRLKVNGVAAQIFGTDERNDLAIVKAIFPGTRTTIRNRRSEVGEQVAAAGYPLRGLLSGFNMTTGTLSSMSGMGGDTRLIQITAPIQPGNSGGPLLDSAGNLMGIVVSKLDVIKASKITGDIAQNVNFAINANVLRSFLDANSVNYETATTDKSVPVTVIAEKAKGFTILVECWK